MSFIKKESKKLSVFKTEAIEEFLKISSNAPTGENIVDTILYFNRLGQFFENIYKKAYSDGSFDQENKMLNKLTSNNETTQYTVKNSDSNEAFKEGYKSAIDNLNSCYRDIFY